MLRLHVSRWTALPNYIRLGSNSLFFFSVPGRNHSVNSKTSFHSSFSCATDGQAQLSITIAPIGPRGPSSHVLQYDGRHDLMLSTRSKQHLF